MVNSTNFTQVSSSQMVKNSCIMFFVALRDLYHVSSDVISTVLELGSSIYRGIYKKKDGLTKIHYWLHYGK